MNPADLFITLLHASTVAHCLHLQTKSYAQHMALGSLYEGIPSLVDGLIEAWQGKNKVIEEYPTKSINVQLKDPVAFCEWMVQYIATNRKAIGSDSELQNIMDEIVELFDSTLYKLKNLS